jgi:hypothetical protein
MKARLAVLVVALALAIAGAFHLARSHAALPVSAQAAAVVVDPENALDIEQQADPGGWWDWH